MTSLGASVLLWIATTVGAEQQAAAAASVVESYRQVRQETGELEAKRLERARAVALAERKQLRRRYPDATARAAASLEIKQRLREIESKIALARRDGVDPVLDFRKLQPGQVGVPGGEHYELVRVEEDGDLVVEVSEARAVDFANDQDLNPDKVREVRLGRLSVRGVTADELDVRIPFGVYRVTREAGGELLLERLLTAEEKTALFPDPLRDP